MHIQPIFSIQELHELYRLIRTYPLATLIGAAEHGLEANLLPMELDETGVQARLLGHVAKKHSVATFPSSSEVIAVFQSPNAYISPRWYANGQRSGRVAPSWDYIAVEVRGQISFVDDPQWIISHLESLTEAQESGRSNPWALKEATPEFVEGASKHLLGFEIVISKVSGKRFLSQQRTETDRLSVAHNLKWSKSASAQELATLIRDTN
ncbi:TPA: FMN-binding negative transcriptional regulator [Burkholderia aenigmatica]|uniref:FMN-binding negative transcriptional regulator n=1 Tax=Burkholderia sp. AU45251 TaxID=3059204 RepID=UPI002652701B|nr:FMN-binding negative transcriptional regulator [Burkholderia sp. AU45251]HDR9482554.1 FMN-binding negative transcriptional regulator [Burkholderia aenigmatica]MDN7517714.1 FMN-binding negative transcriptional regulator [Burkholderia sp. AU45251]HDR9513501.1 FMN-binding negative transcriptional regulator [Burkholderia aenigmatica]HDR9590892.1 FMN-binding negative transcriptional regulator [Burkholderia aenigmatica]HDR9601680.1 FMN-binding negative transcriptional regulator [Burkholderia aeni